MYNLTHPLAIFGRNAAALRSSVASIASARTFSCCCKVKRNAAHSSQTRQPDTATRGERHTRSRWNAAGEHRR